MELFALLRDTLTRGAFADTGGKPPRGVPSLFSGPQRATGT